MEAYLPTGPTIVATLAALLLTLLACGFALPRLRALVLARVLAWTLLVLGTISVSWLCESQPPGFRMLALIAMALLAMKSVVAVEERASGLPPLPFARWLAFAALWLGMQPRIFATKRDGLRPGAGALARRGAGWLAAGAILIVLAKITWNGTHSLFLATLCLLPGLSLVLHFGLCNLAAAAWRLAGFPCEALFRAPLSSQNLAEFWSRRWNVGFSEMTAIAVYRPLSSRLGRSPALFAGFLLSGLLHETAISAPVRAGYGGPLLYFAIHGALVLVERALSRAGRPLEGWGGRAWTLLALALPLPLLFHRPFLAGVIWPLIGIEAT